MKNSINKVSITTVCVCMWEIIRKGGFGSLERKYLWEDISHLSKSENVQSA